MNPNSSSSPRRGAQTARRSVAGRLLRVFGRREALWVGLLVGGMTGVSLSVATIPTTIQNFFLAGTQPNMLLEPIADAQECMACHAYYDAEKEPGRLWAASMMGQSARDPIFHAALAIANQDAAFAGELCIRCHVPGGWLEGRSKDPTGGMLNSTDMQGVSCNFCHRMVDPVYTPGSSPPVDQKILAQINPKPESPHSGNYIVDPVDRRRGPLDLGPEFTWHTWLKSPFHSKSAMCATCHDVSNPVFMRQPDGSYAMNTPGQPHPTGNKADMFPLERTFSEWSHSIFAQGPVDVGGRFGGNLPAVSSCQDCHMPHEQAKNCVMGDPRPSVPLHHFNGANTWVLKAIRNLYDDSETFLTAATVDASIARAREMLQKASDAELTLQGVGGQARLRVRIINQTGHKLPTGYPEGRRMWVNVRFFDAQNNLIAERGRYDASTAALTIADTKVYEAKLGVDAAVAAAAGVPAGEGFHFAINNVWILDNRIPPRGFTNAAFAAVQAAPVGYAYADGQYWDDTLYHLPPDAVRAEARVYFQLVTKEYIEFLRDKNVTNNAGLVAYQQWELLGKSPPELMDQAALVFGPVCYANCDGSTGTPALSPADFICFLNRYRAGDPWANCDGSTSTPALTPADFVCFLNRYRAGCP